jgi:predicted nuclease of restriction endonuclease-like RecB superfamily
LLDTASREQVVEQVAKETGLDEPDVIMYADRQGAQVLAEFQRPAAGDLIRRYNVAQVQGILYSAREMTVDLGAGADARIVFHYVKFMDLIYRLEILQNGYRVYLDGPLSLFGSTRKYGLRLAKFLPGLLLTAPWKLSATVDWKGREALLRLDSGSSGLVSHYAGPKDHREGGDVRESFVRAWKRARETGGWELQPGAGVLPLPELKTALVPDFTLKREPTGEEVHLEILGFWTERTLVDRVALIRAAEERGHRVLIAASENLGTSSQTLSGAVQSEVISFKGRLSVRAVLEAVDSGRARS